MFPRLVTSTDGLRRTWSQSLETLDDIDTNDVLYFQTGPETAVVYSTAELCDFWIRRLAGTSHDVSDFDCPYDIPDSFMPVALPHMPHGTLSMIDQAKCWCRMALDDRPQFMDFWVSCIRRKRIFETRFLFDHLLKTAREMYTAMGIVISDPEILGEHLDDYEVQMDMIKLQAAGSIGMGIQFHNIPSKFSDTDALDQEAMSVMNAIVCIPDKIISILWFIFDHDSVIDRLGQLTQALDRSNRRVRRTVLTVHPEPGILRIDIHDSAMLNLSPSSLSIQLHDVVMDIDTMCHAVLPNARLIGAAHPWSLICGMFHRNIWATYLFTRAPRDIYAILSDI